jgi:glutaredoxin
VTAIGLRLLRMDEALWRTDPSIAGERLPRPKRVAPRSEPADDPASDEPDRPEGRPGHSVPEMAAPTTALREIALSETSPNVEASGGQPDAGSAATATQAQLRAAVGNLSVVMFATAECPHCRRARAFLQANGIRYTERNIDTDPAARAELTRRSGETAVPTLEVDGTLLQAGFSPATPGDALARAVERRLGIPGARVQFKAGS